MIRNWLAKTVHDRLSKEFDGEFPSVDIGVPKTESYGDFSSNIAFGLAKLLRKSPAVIAAEFGSKLDIPGVNVSWVGGFINFKLDDSFLFEKWIHSHSAEIPPVTVPEKMLLEFVSANPTGPLHIGHGRWAVIGSCLANILKAVGHDVQSEFYVNDAGNQIALFRASVAAVASGQPIPDNGYHGDYVRMLATTTASVDDPVEAMRQSQSDVLESMGTTFDRWFSEKTLHESGKVHEVIQDLRRAGVVYDSEGAVWFRTTDFGDDKDRVLIKSDGALTYFAVDIAYHADKLARCGNRLINIWGADHHGYVARVRAAVAVLNQGATIDFDIIIGQLVSLLKDGEPVRMSKRTGELVTLDEIIEEIGRDATRFFLAMKSADSTIEFDLALAKKQSSDNPVYYVQYAHARICAIFRKLGIHEALPVELISINSAERDVISWGLQFSDEVHNAADHLAPHRIVHYLVELARRVHTMYEQSPILKSGDGLKHQRLHILNQARQILSAGLSLLGISAPEEM